jgi:hypothetical protein
MLMRSSCEIRALTIVGLLTAPGSFAEAAEVPQPTQLTDTQLDKIAAGVFATAVGNGSARGQVSRTEVTVAANARSGGLPGDSVLGQVSAIAISSAGPRASASSTLSLSVSYP